jgi:transposase-like protein
VLPASTRVRPSGRTSIIQHPCLYLVTRSLDPKGTGQQRWTMRWKPALNAFAITFGDRMPKAENH